MHTLDHLNDTPLDVVALAQLDQFLVKPLLTDAGHGFEVPGRDFHHRLLVVRRLPAMRCILTGVPMVTCFFCDGSVLGRSGASA